MFNIECVRVYHGYSAITWWFSLSFGISKEYVLELCWGGNFLTLNFGDFFFEILIFRLNMISLVFVRTRYQLSLNWFFFFCKPKEHILDSRLGGLLLDFLQNL